MNSSFDCDDRSIISIIPLDAVSKTVEIKSLDPSPRVSNDTATFLNIPIHESDTESFYQTNSILSFEKARIECIKYRTTHRKDHTSSCSCHSLLRSCQIV